MRRLLAACVLGVLASGLLTTPAHADAHSETHAGTHAGTPTSARGGVRAAQPVLAGDFPDPTIARWRGRYVSVATGSMAPRAVAPTASGPWTRTGPALASLPSWARDDAVWATDLVQVDGRWRLYFSVPARGLGPYGRCIGVASAATPLGRFRPAPEPLVCPVTRRGGVAADQVNAPGVPLPAGVIDPDVHQARDGSLLLLYRTQGVPSTIRAVPLTPDGRSTTQATSTTLVVSSGVVENPLLLQHASPQGLQWVLVTSEGYFGSCDYRTTVQRAATLDALALAPREELARRGTTGLCGPGGADLVGRTLFLHAWTCPAGRPRCRVPERRRQDGPRFAAKRSLYAARIGWSDTGALELRSFLRPRSPSGVVPSRRDPIVQDGLGAVPTAAGLALPVTTVLGGPGSSVRALRAETR